MPHLSPPTLTRSETEAILAATASHPRDHLIYSLALGTGLRLAEIVGLNVGDVFAPDGTPRSRVRIRPEIAKGGRAGDVFLPDALLPKLRKFRAQPMRTCPESSGFLEPAGPRHSCQGLVSSPQDSGRGDASGNANLAPSTMKRSRCEGGLLAVQPGVSRGRAGGGEVG